MRSDPPFAPVPTSAPEAPPSSPGRIPAIDAARAAALAAMAAYHLIWDLGYGFGPSEREWLTRAALIGSLTLTIVVWIVAYVMGGGR